MQLAGRQQSAASAAALEVKESVGKEGDASISLDLMLEQPSVSPPSLRSSPPQPACLLTKGSAGSRGPWPPFLCTSER